MNGLNLGEHLIYNINAHNLINWEEWEQYQNSVNNRIRNISFPYNVTLQRMFSNLKNSFKIYVDLTMKHKQHHEESYNKFLEEKDLFEQNIFEASFLTE